MNKIGKRLQSVYNQELAALEKRKCRECSGLGTCTDAEPGDISFNEWTCTQCEGTGLTKQPGET